VAPTLTALSPASAVDPTPAAADLRKNLLDVFIFPSFFGMVSIQLLYLDATGPSAIPRSSCSMRVLENAVQIKFQTVMPKSAHAKGRLLKLLHPCQAFCHIYVTVGMRASQYSAPAKNHNESKRFPYIARLSHLHN
jgi:hypothetical protein